MWWAHALFIIGCYLLGSIPFLLYIARWHRVDIKEGEDLHIAVWTRVGRLYALYGILFDIFVKGSLPVIVGYFAGLPMAVVLTGAVVSATGQMWPVFRRFKGEKGNTVSLGIVLVATIIYHQWWMYLISIPVAIGSGIKVLPRMLAPGQSLSERFRLGGPQSRSLPLGILTGFIMMPLIALAFGYPGELAIIYGALVIMIVIRRLTDEGLKEDMKKGPAAKVLWNRFLYDRSFV
ncbi:MAG: glycerol-3-phosphate acyltransferase [Dehalococcoidia bacterium]|nr:glycerol-3-phosphate acyltransferase [Dehalococcoidia bacterium]